MADQIIVMCGGALLALGAVDGTHATFREMDRKVELGDYDSNKENFFIFLKRYLMKEQVGYKGLTVSKVAQRTYTKWAFSSLRQMVVAKEKSALEKGLDTVMNPFRQKEESSFAKAKRAVGL